MCPVHAADNWTKIEISSSPLNKELLGTAKNWFCQCFLRITCCFRTFNERNVPTLSRILYCLPFFPLNGEAWLIGLSPWLTWLSWSKQFFELRSEVCFLTKIVFKFFHLKEVIFRSTNEWTLPFYTLACVSTCHKTEGLF